MDEFKRVRAAIKDQPKKPTVTTSLHKTGRMMIHTNPHCVQVVAGDVAFVCNTVPVHDEITAALLMGATAGKPDRVVLQQAPDLWHLLSKAVEPNSATPASDPEPTT